ncbi:MAG TPA: NHL repeat-containing protein, partial [Anaerolineaceae bacterium]|nr:NHL repeat-containing protein [Anaerolineaceae bacterium]
IDAQGRLYVVDTGNDRVVVFDPDGNFITQFGTEGFDPGFIDEPMGIALDAEGNVYLADTWNQRMQVFSSLETGFTYLRHWDITGWFGTSLQNYPFVAVSPDQHVFVTDPEGYRVLEFTANGEFVRGWGGYSPSSDGFGLASAVRVDSQGRVWVSDAGNHMLLRFNLPAEIP